MRINPISFSINNSYKPVATFQPHKMSRTDSDTITFTGNNTSAGNVLKKLRDIVCPYTGIKMISGSSLNSIEKRIDKSQNISTGVKILSGYTDYMQKTEKRMFNTFKKYSETNPQGKFGDCLNKLYDNALAKLKIEEFLVLDKVDKISLSLSPQTALGVRSKTTRCRQVILANKAEDTFKRKTFITSLDEIVPANINEQKILEQMKDQALFLPTSGSSENAFIVKYARRSEQEIAKRMLRASVATIEHVKPDSLGGANTLGNFMLVSAQANSRRANMPLEKYIQRYPDIPSYCQMYINQIISSIYKGKLGGCETYPYKIKKTLENESNGQIVLNLSKYKYTEAQTEKMVRQYYSKQHSRR